MSSLSSAEAASFPSSSRIPPYKYDVFVSFCGADTRHGFTSHLCAALKGKGIITFADEHLERGGEIVPPRLKAFQESLCFIVVLSKGFPFSTWCLDELVAILRQKQERGLKVFPVFYHVDPSDVRRQTGTFEEAFSIHEKRFIDKDRTMSWRCALTEVSNLQGWYLNSYNRAFLLIFALLLLTMLYKNSDLAQHLLSFFKVSRHEADAVQEIVEYVSARVPSDLVGSNLQSEDLHSEIGIGENDVRVTGSITGMGGIGKSTLSNVEGSRSHGVLLCKNNEWWGNHSSLDQNMNDLKRKLEELNALMEDTEEYIELRKLHPRKKIKKEVQLWLENVQKINDEIHNLEQRVQKSYQYPRGYFKENILKKTREVEDLFLKGDLVDCVAVEDDQLVGAFCTSLFGEAAGVCMKEIWACLMDDTIGKIGVWGQGGVGKTTIMKFISNQLQKWTEMFGMVIWISGKKDMSIAELQDGIACAIGMQETLSKEVNETIRAGVLYVRLAHIGRLAFGYYYGSEQHERIPDLEEWAEDLEKVSLMGNWGLHIPWKMSPPKCQMLTTLLLPKCFIESIPETFFEQMPKLKILDLSYNSIKSLPNSFSDLENLTTLILFYCESLENVPSFSKLLALKDLDLVATNIKDLPHGMEMLVNLRSLAVSSIIEIPIGILPEFCRLHYLNVGDTLITGEELMGLGELEILTGRFNDLEDLNKFVEAWHGQGKGLLEYCISVGGRSIKDQIYKKCLELNCCAIDADVLKLPSDVEQLIVCYCKVDCCVGAFFSRFIPVPFGIFYSLKVITITNCRKVKKLFPQVLQNIQNLEVVDIRNCYEMEEIIASDSEMEEGGTDNIIKFTFPKLKRLLLANLPQLKSISSANGVMVCDSLEMVSIQDCPNIRRIPLYLPLLGDGQPSPPPSLRYIVIPEECFKLLEWDHPNAKDLLLPFLLKATQRKNVLKRKGKLHFHEIEDVHQMGNSPNVLVVDATLKEKQVLPTTFSFDEETSQQLQLRYDELADSKVKNCLLYCVLYPEEFEISKEELVSDWIADGLVDKMSSMKEEFEKGHDVINRLLESSFLKNVKDGKCVKLPKLVRDMSLLNTNIGPRFIVKAGIGLKEFPNREDWTEDLLKVSLMENCISEIPSGMLSPKCQMLTTLLLSKNCLQSIPESFFEQMQKLKVLDLSHNLIVSLPHSVCNLENLTTLLLGGCERLMSLPSLSLLQSLEKLDLHRTAIEELPQGLEMLVKLRYLNLGVTFLEQIPHGILSKLPCLSYLNVYPISVRLGELMMLRKLETFVGWFSDVDDLNMYIKTSHGKKEWPSKYYLCVGELFDDGHLDKFSNRSIALSVCSNREDLIDLPSDIQQLAVKCCDDMSSLNDFVTLEDVTDLRDCFISDCKGMECVFSLCCTPLKTLEVLRLEGLVNLNFLLGGTAALSHSIFSCLRIFEISSCSKIKSLFLSMWVLRDLQNLEDIRVRSCKDIEEIITSDAESTDSTDTIKLSLPKLRRLTFQELPEFKSICSTGMVMVCYSLQYISIRDCPKFERIPLFLPLKDDGQPFHPSLKQIVMYPKLCWNTLEWEHPHARDALSPMVTEEDVLSNT
ncbi:hypothetical protein COLO4_32230 [Corchorus olitorius]|uniref:TIR domain-containing protein n=1 Tax=Corchorus olitorius TaxID=93759 RepID=A0A1R3H032_9ROSI|nr:hypothetical protein COLO4_32230 [Corchorus olitorius]